jgi:AraC family transcriptional regulator
MSSFGPSRFENGRPMLLGGLRQRHALAATELDLAEQWRRFKSRGELPARVGTSSYGVMCGHDATGFEYMCGVEVESFAGLPEGTGRLRVPAQRYAIFGHHGDGTTLRETWLRILEWLSSSDYESAHRPDFELYGPQSDPLDGGGEIEVWVGVVPKQASG